MRKEEIIFLTLLASRCLKTVQKYLSWKSFDWHYQCKITIVGIILSLQLFLEHSFSKIRYSLSEVNEVRLWPYLFSLFRW